MDINEIRAEVKQNIATVTGIDPAEIGDSASYREDLGLDSLSILEVAVNMEYRYKIKVPEEELSGIRTVADTVELVQRHLGAKPAGVCDGELLSQA